MERERQQGDYDGAGEDGLRRRRHALNYFKLPILCRYFKYLHTIFVLLVKPEVALNRERLLLDLGLLFDLGQTLWLALDPL